MTARRAAVLLIGLAALVPTMFGSAGHAAGVETGWWWKGTLGGNVPVPEAVPAPGVTFPVSPPANVPVPPNVPAGGLMVAALPDGAASIAAVRAPVNAASLTLNVSANGNSDGAAAHLIACRPAFPWNPTSAGRWDDKPIVACDVSNGGASVAGIPAADGKSWTFPVLPLVVGDTIDVVIVPAADPAVPRGLLAPFQLVFDPPSLASFQINPPTLKPVATTDDPPTFGDSNALATDASATAFDTTPLGAGGGFAPIATPALPRGSQAAPRLAVAVPGARSKASTGAQTLAVVMLLVAALVGWAVSRQPLPAVQSLARMGGGRRPPQAIVRSSGGLGRFTRTRSGRPPSLF